MDELKKLKLANAATKPVEDELPALPNGILQDTGKVLGGGLAAVGNLFDLPGSSVRDVTTWVPGGVEARNPFDQWIDPLGYNAHENRVYGREILRANNLASDQDTWGNAIAGFGYDIATDPLFYLTGGLTKAGEAIAKTGAAKLTRPAANLKAQKLAGEGSKLTRPIRGVGARAKVTPQDIFDSITDEAARSQAWQEFKAAGGTEAMLTEPMSAIKLKVPLSGYINSIYKSRTGKDLPEAFVRGVEILKTNPSKAMERFVARNSTRPGGGDAPPPTSAVDDTPPSGGADPINPVDPTPSPIDPMNPSGMTDEAGDIQDLMTRFGLTEDEARIVQQRNTDWMNQNRTNPIDDVNQPQVNTPDNVNTPTAQQPVDLPEVTSQRFKMQDSWMTPEQIARRDAAISKVAIPPTPQRFNVVGEVTSSLEPLRSGVNVDGVNIKAIPHPQGSLIGDGGGRPMVVMDIDGVKVPFYQSTGDGGKVLQQGAWYPFWGVNADWINKTNAEEMAEYYGSRKIAAAAQILDNTTGNITHMLTPGRRGEFEKGAVSLGTLGLNKESADWINQGRQTFDGRGWQSTLGLRGSINKVLNELGEEGYYRPAPSDGRLTTPEKAAAEALKNPSQSFMKADDFRPEAVADNAIRAVESSGEVWSSPVFRGISDYHKMFDDDLAGLVNDGALKSTDADILRLAFSGASRDGMSIMSRPRIRAVDSLATSSGEKAAGQWRWGVSDKTGMLEFHIDIAKDRPASQSGASVLLHELGHMAQFAYRQIPGNDMGGELSKLINNASKNDRLLTEFTGLHGEKLGEYLAHTFDEQFPQLFADSIIRRKVPQGALGKIITDVRDWVVQFLEKIKVVKSIPKPTQKRIDGIIDELLGFDKPGGASKSSRLDDIPPPVVEKKKGLFERLNYQSMKAGDDVNPIPVENGKAFIPDNHELDALKAATAKVLEDAATRAGHPDLAKLPKEIRNKYLPISQQRGKGGVTIYVADKDIQAASLIDPEVIRGHVMASEGAKVADQVAAESVAPMDRTVSLLEQSKLQQQAEIESIKTGKTLEESLNELNNRTVEQSKKKGRKKKSDPVREQTDQSTAPVAVEQPPITPDVPVRDNPPIEPPSDIPPVGRGPIDPGDGVPPPPLDLPPRMPVPDVPETFGNRAYDFMTDAVDRAGDLFYKIPFASAAASHFRPSIKGALTEEGREIGRMISSQEDEALSQARFNLYSMARNLQESKLLDEEAIMKAEGLTKEQAVAKLNSRATEILDYIEGRSFLPDELKPIQGSLDEMRRDYDDMFFAENADGLRLKALNDEYSDYVRRLIRNPGKETVATMDPNRGAVINTKHKSMMQRADEFRDLPGGTGVINDMSIDGNISGIRWINPVIKKTALEKADLTAPIIQTPEGAMSIREYVFKEYGDRLLSEEALKNFDPTKSTDLDALIRRVASFDRGFVDAQMPIFGRDPIYDYWVRKQDSVRARNVARAAMDMTGKALVDVKYAEYPENQLVRVDKMMSDMKIWNSNAMRHVINSADPKVAQAVEGAIDARVQSSMESLAKGKQVRVRIGDDQVTLVPIMEDKTFTGRAVEKRLVNKDYTDLNHKYEAETGAFDDLENVSKAKKGKKRADLEENEIDITPEYLAGIVKDVGTMDGLKGFAVPKPLWDEAVRFMKPFSEPEATVQMLAAARALTNMFKTGATAAFPAFHSRNFISGQVNNFLHDAYDPRFVGWKRYAQPVKDAMDLNQGKAFDGIEDIYKGMKPEDAVEALQKEIFTVGLLGEKQGVAAEVLGDSIDKITSQIPGVAPLPNPAAALRKAVTTRPDGTGMFDAVNPLGSKGGYTISKDGIKELADDTFIPYRWGRDTAAYTEFMNRVSPYIAYRRQGFSPAAAKRMVDKTQVDYSNLTPFERKYMRLVVPFWTYSKGQLPVVLEDIIKRPGGGIATMIKASNSLRDKESPIPEHIANTLAIPLGRKSDGSQSYLTGLGLGYEDTLNLLNGPLRGDVSETLREFLGRANPMIKAPAEKAFGRSAFWDGPEVGGRPLTELDPPIGRTLSNISDMLTGEQTKRADPFISQGFEHLVSNSPVGRFTSTARQLTDQRKWESPLHLAMNLLSGARVNDVSPEVQDSLLRDRIGAILKDSGARKFSRDYLPDYAKEKLTPEQLQEVETLMEALKVIEKRFKLRREAKEE